MRGVAVRNQMQQRMEGLRKVHHWALKYSSSTWREHGYDVCMVDGGMGCLGDIATMRSDDRRHLVR